MNLKDKNQPMSFVFLMAALGIIVAVGFLFLKFQGIGTVGGIKGEDAKVAELKNGGQEVTIELSSRAYAPIVVQEGVPLKFNIKATKETINSCNGTVIIPEYGIEKTLVPGDNIIEFTPQQVGTIPYSCWMGMVRSSIEVVPDLKTADISAISQNNNVGAVPSCCNQPQ